MTNSETHPSLFAPLTIRGMTLSNRVVMSPMLMYMAGEDGLAGDLHLVHYGARILGGVGMVMTEVVAVTPDGRISDHDLGIWSDEHIPGLARLVAFAHDHDARMGIQLAHAGRKSKAQPDIVGPSPLAYGDFPTPHELSESELGDIVEAYRLGARRAREAGFDCIELHAGHGYLLHEFLSPVSNHREDAYGGDLRSRGRLLFEVVEAVRSELGDDQPLFVRLSAEDKVEGGLTMEDSIELSRGLVERGVDLFDVSTGNIVPGYGGAIYPGYQVSAAERIGKELGAKTGVVGSISSPELADYVVSSGISDLVFVGRALLGDPFWLLKAAKSAGVDIAPPIPTYARATGPYERGF